MPQRKLRFAKQRRKVGVDSDWYIPSTFFQQLSEVSSEIPIGFSWPGDAKFAFVLTHDVETEDGLRSISKLADLESPTLEIADQTTIYLVLVRNEIPRRTKTKLFLEIGEPGDPT